MKPCQVILFNLWGILWLCLKVKASLVSVTECDNKEKLGSIVNVDFMAINQPCNCEVKPQFSGDLVFASNVVLYDCFTEITIRKNAQNDDIFAVRCPRTHSSKMYSVSNSSVFEISSTYLRRTGDTSFHQSIQIFQDKSFNEPIAVTCVLNEDLVLPTTPSVQVTSTETPTSSSDALIVGLVITALLVVILIGVIFFIVAYFIRNQKRTKESEEKNEHVEPSVSMTNITAAPMSPYTDLNADQANNPTEQPYTPLANDSEYQEIGNHDYERPITEEEEALEGTEDQQGTTDRGHHQYRNAGQQVQTDTHF